jgi:cation diffusion facilitator family transporter
MHSHSLDNWTHDHVFLGGQHARNERRTWLVVGLTVGMMIAEIIGGTIFGSMALLADGWHMSTHAMALGIAAFTYRYARRHAHDARFVFGTGKLGELAAFTSAVVLAMVALGIAYESFVRFANPVPIAYGEAIAIAAVGLAVNAASAWLLRDDHDHHHHHHHSDDDHHHDHTRGHAHHHAHDNNLRAAYIHVLADAATSVLAIVALLLARSYGWIWVDPLVGVIGSIVIASWAYGLMKSSGSVLIDVMPDHRMADDIRNRLETGGDRISDLHVWQVGPGHQAAIISIVTHVPQTPSFYKDRLADLASLSHVTVEVTTCEGDHSDVEVAHA